MRRRVAWRIGVCLVSAMLGAAHLSGVEILPDDRKIEPLARIGGPAAFDEWRKDPFAAPARQDAPVPVFIRLSAEEEDLPAMVGALGGTARKIHPRLYAGRIPRDATRYLSNWPGVAYIEAGKRVRPLLDLSQTAISADLVHSGSGLPPPFDATGLNGAGAFVGVVDTGLHGAHSDFRAGGASRVLHTYRFPPPPQTPPTDPLVDEDGHGTHVTGIAAGNGASSAGLYTGIAPGAGLLIGKTSFTTTDIATAVGDLLAFAGATPAAINLSLGGTIGPHDGTSLFEESINALATGPSGSRRIVSVAAGNEQIANEHFRATLGSFGSVTAFLSILPTQPPFPAVVDVWADGEDRYAVTATVPGGSASVFNRSDQPLNGATHIQILVTAPSGASATVRFDRTRNGGSGVIDAYIDALFDGTFTAGSTPSGTVTEPANADNVIAVGSFNTKTFGGAGIPPPQPLSPFSSLGPTRDSRIKPDITAPGSIIYSARSFDAAFNPSEIVPGNDNYVIMQGTSMAAPHAAGTAALAWQSSPLLTGAQMRERLRRTANPVPSPGTPNSTWGYGRLNALRAVTETVASITAPGTATPGSLVTLRADEKSSGPFGQAQTYSWSVTGAGANVSPPTGPSTAFTAASPGNYDVTVSASPGAPPSNTDTVRIRVNHVPSATIAGPASSDNAAPATFLGSAADQDAGQTHTFRWILLSRPAGSAATFSPGNTDNATFDPDVVGAYEIGLHVDDGLDNSALVTRTYTAGPLPALPASGGGGGCSLAGRVDDDDPASALPSLLLLLSPAFAPALRRMARRG